MRVEFALDEADPHKIERAKQIIAAAEKDLKRKLSPGERRDLLTDNTTWTRSDIFEVEAATR